MQPRTPSKAEPYRADGYSPADRTLGSDSVVILPRNYSDLLYNEHKKLTRHPQYRNSRSGGARSNRSHIDHDVFEGLPVRHWRKRPINVTVAPEKENTNDMKARNLAWPELEMPRDYHLLAELSQNLLRAARMPQAKKSIIAPLMEDDKDTGEDEDADRDIDAGFIAKRWAVVPKDLEGPEPEFLAKRRKGLPSIHGGAIAALGTTQQMRKTKIRKLDSGGGSSVLEVLVPEGQSVDGEIFEEETSPIQAPAPGTVVEGVGVVNAEGVVIAGDQGVPANNRRRPPPPKRRAKGPGRGKKKRVAFAGPDGKPTSRETNEMPNGTIRMEGDHMVDGGQGVPDHDRAAGDESMLQDGEEGSEDGSEGEEGEEGDREEGELSPSPSPPTSPSKDPQPLVAGPEAGHQNILPNSPNPSQDASNTIKMATEPPLNSVAEPIIEPCAEAVAEAMDQGIDEVVLDEPVGEPGSGDANIPVNEPLTQSIATNIAESSTEMTMDIRGGDLDVTPQRPTAEPEPSLKVSTEDVVVELKQPLPQQPPGEITTNPPNETVANPVMSEPEIESLAESKPEPMPNTSAEAILEPEAEPSIQRMDDEPAPTSAVDVSMEVNTDAPVESDLKTVGESTVEPVVEGPAPPFAQDLTDQAAADVPELSPEPIRQATPLVDAGSFPPPVTRAVEEPAPPPIEEAQPGPPPPLASEPIVQRAAEIHDEPPLEPAERRFSFTRPTASPKAPTPSPPTPIEDKFALRAPYVSPKAPTMSPPTPIDRSMPSSPDVPLAEQHFELPPPIDVTEEAKPAPVPDMRHIPDADRISVEAAPQVEQINAQIPVEHDPLDGMAEPKVANSSTDDRRASDRPILFPDGEEDLLGSLERSLDQRDRTS